MASAQENLWQFSNRVYRKPGVAEACLRLQNGMGADVNLLLFAAWYGVTRGVLNEQLIAETQRVSVSWSGAVVKPLRGARTWMKQVADDLLTEHSDSVQQQFRKLREQIKSTELQAEHLQQNMLLALVETCAQVFPPAVQQQQVAANLQFYLPDPAPAFAADVALLAVSSDTAPALHNP